MSESKHTPGPWQAHIARVEVERLRAVERHRDDMAVVLRRVEAEVERLRGTVERLKGLLEERSEVLDTTELQVLRLKREQSELLADLAAARRKVEALREAAQRVVEADDDGALTDELVNSLRAALAATEQKGSA